MKLTRIITCSGCIIFMLLSARALSQNPTIDFESGQWDLGQGKVVEHLGRQALMGTAYLEEAIFSNGTIEVDIATTAHSRSYPAVLFRVKDVSNYERVYIRPHRSHFYEDALQYAPTFNGVDSWQLYNGPGKTASLDIPAGQWNHLKIVVSGDQARIFWNTDTVPALIIDHLAHGSSEGSLGLSGTMDGTAYFSSFTYESTGTLQLPDVPATEPMTGVISDWELSSPFALLKADFTAYPGESLLGGLEWQGVKADDQGMVDVSRCYSRNSRAGDVILAKTIIPAEKDTLMRIGLGYSDFITVFLNKQPVFFGNSAYRSRDPSFLGIVGYFDVLFLPLKTGNNELMVQLGETMGGWGFCLRKDAEEFIHPSVQKKWEVKNEFSVPECVVCDAINGVCYVSNYFNEGNEFISKISLNGEVIAREWITGMKMPTGMAVKDGKLYVADRTNLNIIDIQKEEIIEKIALTGMPGPNDVAVDAEGNIYLSDTRINAVFSYAGGTLEPWLENLDGPNGLLVDGDHLMIGQNERLLRVNLSDKATETIAIFERGSNLDGLQMDSNGDYLVSDYRGKLYRVTKTGEKTVLIDTSTPAGDIADFGYAQNQRLIIIPTLRNNTVVAYSVQK